MNDHDDATDMIPPDLLAQCGPTPEEGEDGRRLLAGLADALA